ncbi:pyruvate ferredoxin oxidoreductase [Candidatus Geothermarchaeota archaeon]|nr:MAG: pyruvate ferredoxin oxidoreductase [Candidatus Geothermarchaeota archaeon]
MEVKVERQIRTGLNGDEAVAYAAYHADVDVIAAYPITPQTIIVERLSEFVHDGLLDAEFIPVESEHSALSAVVGAAASGVRTFTATASQGLALMYEILYIASSLRLPIVMALADRALSALINIHCSHDDAYAARDSGWIEFFAENVQEAYDLVIAAFRVAEDKNISFPAIVNLDGFILSHSIEPLYIYEGQDVVREFLPRREPIVKLDPDKPITIGALALQNYYIELKRAQAEAFEATPPYIRKILREYSEFSGRKYDFIKKYMVDDADIGFLVLGSTAGTMRHVVRKWREKGRKVGLISLTLYRPFPVDDLRDAVKGLKKLVIMDRSYSFGSPYAQLYMDVAATLYDEPEKPDLINVIYGLGGRDFNEYTAEEMWEKINRPGVKKIWVGVRGD